MPSLERTRIAIIEDDPIMGESLAQRLTLEGYETVWWQTGRAALEGLRKQRPDLVVCDMRLPDMTGEEMFRSALPEMTGEPILFITAYGTIDEAVRLIRAGANDYLAKPFQMSEFLSRIEHLLDARGRDEATGALGQSAAMRRVEAVLRRVANLDSTLLLTGESGVGKEVAARFVHQVSRRAVAPFVAVNCAAIPTNLLESELFGHERGAFTGAVQRHAGYAERAGDGILFLDEVSELPSELQAKLLRLVQDRDFLRLGGERPVSFTARLVCATNAELEQRVASGQFRRDLYFRINVIPIEIAPLRDRDADILPLLRHYVGHFSESFGSEVRGLTTRAEAAALAHSWPGNVRELRHRAERAVALATSPWIDAHDLFPDLEPHRDEPGGTDMAPLTAVRAEAERRHIVAALERAGGQPKRAAELLGISRTTLWEKMRKLGLAVGDQPEP